MNILKKLVSLLLVLLFSVGFCVNAFAITLSGMHNGYYYAVLQLCRPQRFMAS